MPPSVTIHPARPEPSRFEPSAALAILDDLGDGDHASRVDAAWDAAWIACLTGSARWAETARREFARATGGAAPGES